MEQVFALGAQARSKLEALWQQLISPWEQMELRPLYKGSKGKWEQHKGRCQEEKKDEGIVKMNQEQGRINQQLVSPTPGGVNQGAPASSLELDLPRVRGVPGEGGSAGKIRNTRRSQERSIQITWTALPWMRKGMTMCEKWCLEQKRKKNSQGKDPENL